MGIVVLKPQSLVSDLSVKTHIEGISFLLVNAIPHRATLPPHRVVFGPLSVIAVRTAISARPRRSEEIYPGVECCSDADLDVFLERAVMTHHHPVGKCLMGHAAGSVVDAIAETFAADFAGPA